MKRDLKNRLCAGIASLLLILSACAGGAGTEAAPLTWQEQYDLGMKYLSDGNYEESILAFQAAIEIDPKRAQGYLGLADAYVGANRLEEALAAVEQGLAGSDDTTLLTQKRTELESALAESRSKSEGTATPEGTSAPDGTASPSGTTTPDGAAMPKESAVPEASAAVKAPIAWGDGTIQITGIAFDKDQFISGGATQFLVDVAYSCPEGAECIVMVGANTMEPESYRMLEADHEVMGTGTYQFSVSLTPTKWDSSDFIVYVNLSARDHADEWTPLGGDERSIGADGTVHASD